MFTTYLTITNQNVTLIEVYMKFNLFNIDRSFTFCKPNQLVLEESSKLVLINYLHHLPKLGVMKCCIIFQN